MTNLDYAIEVNDVSMCFRMTTEKISSLKEYLIKIAKQNVTYKEFWALSSIDFKVRKGEVFGILGLNGAGKSTLLKLISGVMKPTKGSVNIRGSMAPLIELGAGFDPELSARENIFLNGAVLGHSKKKMENLYDQIVDFAELEEFMEVPVKNFSSGMYARLGFAIATSVSPDILIVDEILSVGDYKFRKKCEKRIEDMIKNSTTILMVSHDIDQMASICSNGIMLEKGNMVCSGTISEVLAHYQSNEINKVGI
ncbi:ABC transporter ATP-binding protein [Paenibacillus sp. TCA20]|uniref:ABC transporter ATP-binding protein n=1 Tax=Paenibacillus sp. TCA20 TaxID=1499968 RepID=UPI00064C4CD4|nr:ABC transporter ATP-binding protein [Paenibacillus sp. TCA20]